MAATWKNIFVEVPADHSTVWIVRIPFFDTPVQATFGEATGTFSWIDSTGNAHTIDIDEIFKWRPL